MKSNSRKYLKLIELHSTERRSKMEKLLCPSMMCANYGNLGEEVEKLEEAGADIFHIRYNGFWTICS